MYKSTGESICRKYFENIFNFVEVILNINSSTRKHKFCMIFWTKYSWKQADKISISEAFIFFLY